MSALINVRQERFAQAYVRTGNQAASYRIAYEVQPGSRWDQIHSRASELVRDEAVAARIKELQDETAERCAIPALADRLREMRSMEATFVDEIQRVNWFGCRYCYGTEHQWQYRDEQEYAEACQLAMRSDQPIPVCTGGYGYHARREPHPECNRCWGVGVMTVELTDSRTWSEGARRLYRGVKVKSDGSFEVLLGDIEKIRDMITRIQGGYKDGAAVPASSKGASEAIAATKTPEERQRAYLRLVAG